MHRSGDHKEPGLLELELAAVSPGSRGGSSGSRKRSILAVVSGGVQGGSSMLGVSSVNKVKCPVAVALVFSQDQLCAVRLRTFWHHGFQVRFSGPVEDVMNDQLSFNKFFSI